MIKIISARKRSLRRSCFHRCLSVYRGVSAPLHAGIHTPPGRHTPQQAPPGQVHPLGRYTPLGRHPPRQVHPLSRYIPWAGTSPGQIHPPTQCMLGYTPAAQQCRLGYGQQAGGTHPTGMHSCSEYD